MIDFCACAVAAVVGTATPDRDPLEATLDWHAHVRDVAAQAAAAERAAAKAEAERVAAAEASTRSAPERSPLSSSLNWAALRQCESGGSYTIVSSNGLWYGAYQFTVSTWQSMGGTGLPSEAPPAEQDMRAQRLYDAAGASPWPVCGKLL